MARLVSNISKEAVDKPTKNKRQLTHESYPSLFKSSVAHFSSEIECAAMVADRKIMEKRGSLRKGLKVAVDGETTFKRVVGEV